MPKKSYSEFKKTETGEDLYNRWVRVRKTGCCDEWAEDFMAFAKWSLDGGYELGAYLKRIDPKKEFSPTNCFWSIGKDTKCAYKASEFCATWNKTVNRLREHYGLTPFIVEEQDNSGKTCKDCVHYKVCKYKADDMPVCDDYLD